VVKVRKQVSHAGEFKTLSRAIRDYEEYDTEVEPDRVFIPYRIALISPGNYSITGYDSRH
jgi:cytochrome c peroxidase